MARLGMVYVFLITLIVANKGSLGPYAVSDLFSVPNLEFSQGN